MARHDELPVYRATYSMMVSIFGFVKHFTKEYKYSVGESLKKETMELMTLIYRANAGREKAEVLQEARERIEVIRLYLRLMMDLHQVSLKQFVRVNQEVEQVSRQLTGWHKSVRA
jgi:hypothetical protein